MIAVGFKDGTVMLIRGNIARDRQSRIRIVHEEKEPGVYVSGELGLGPGLGLGLWLGAGARARDKGTVSNQDSA